MLGCAEGAEASRAPVVAVRLRPTLMFCSLATAFSDV